MDAFYKIHGSPLTTRAAGRAGTHGSGADHAGAVARCRSARFVISAANSLQYSAAITR